MPLEDAAVSLAGGTDAAEGAVGAVGDVGPVGAEEEKNEEHPARVGQTASESSIRTRLEPLPRPVLQAFGHMGSAFPIRSLYPADDGGLNYE